MVKESATRPGAFSLALVCLLASTVGGVLGAALAPVAAQVATPVASTTPLGAETPVVTLQGERTTWGALGVPGHARLVVFATAWCASCRAEVPAVEAWAAAHAERADVVYVFSGSGPERIREVVAEYGPRSPGVAVVVDEDGALARHFGVRATPTLLFWGDLSGAARQVEHLEEIELADATPAPHRADERVIVADSGQELGTSYDVFVIVDAGVEERARADLAEARSLVRTLERRFSEWREDSEISALNAAIARGEGTVGVPLAPDLARLVAGAVHVSQVTEGAFDPCWRPLGALWDAAAARGSAPDSRGSASSSTTRPCDSASRASRKGGSSTRPSNSCAAPGTPIWS
jgi:thiol-disulfide isomerase/thioredoxin